MENQKSCPTNYLNKPLLRHKGTFYTWPIETSKSVNGGDTWSCQVSSNEIVLRNNDDTTIVTRYKKKSIMGVLKPEKNRSDAKQR